MVTEYTKQTDQIHEVKLESSITHAIWHGKTAAVGAQVSLEVLTELVGNGSEIKIKVKDKESRTIEKLKGHVYGNTYKAKIAIPENAKEELSYVAKLPKHGLEMDSEILTVIPPVNVTNQAWSEQEARRGDIVTLSADTEGIPDDTEVMIYIYEYDQDGAHDFITQFPTSVKQNKIELEWKYEYHEDTDEIPAEEEMQEYGKHYNPPEYFWVAEVAGTRFGEEQGSGLLKFKDWIEVRLTNGPEEPIAGEPYILYLPDGEVIEGNTNNEGRIKEGKIPPGKVFVEFPGLFGLVVIEDGRQIEGTDRGTRQPTMRFSGSRQFDEPIPDDVVEFEDDDDENGEALEEEELGEMNDPDDLEDERVTASYDDADEEECECPEQYEIASAYRVSGRCHHLAVMHCISVRLLSSQGLPIGRSIDFELKDKSDKCLIMERSRDGSIFYDGVGIGEYNLIVDGSSYWVSSSDNASDVENVRLRSPKE